MDWNLSEALEYYKTQGAPGDQNALVALLKEVQQENGGSIPQWILPRVCERYSIKSSYLSAIIGRIPSLRLSDTHCLEICTGPNCSKKAQLAALAEKLCKDKVPGLQIKYTGCMRMCGKGPNIKWDGHIYHSADDKLIRQLIEESAKEK